MRLLLQIFYIKHLEYISRIRNIAIVMFRQNEINETMSQNMQSLNKQNVDNVQYKISRDHPTSEAQGELKGECMKAKGGLSG
jgi:hypothetical protein